MNQCPRCLGDGDCGHPDCAECCECAGTGAVDYEPCNGCGYPVEECRCGSYGEYLYRAEIGRRMLEIPGYGHD